MKFSEILCIVFQRESLQSASPPIEIVRASFNIAIIVWNAHVMAMPVWNAPRILAQLEALLKTPKAAPEMVQAYRDLTERRQTLFANDPRSVGQWSVSVDERGNVRLRCDAHVPPLLMPREKKPASTASPDPTLPFRV